MRLKQIQQIDYSKVTDVSSRREVVCYALVSAYNKNYMWLQERNPKKHVSHCKTRPCHCCGITSYSPVLLVKILSLYF